MMKVLSFLCLVLSLGIVSEAKEVDTRLLQCLVCRATVKEMEGELAKINPSLQVEVGNYRMDAQGNTVHKKVPLAQSEVHLSDMLDNICDKMSDYVRATYKSNGQLTILNLMTPQGTMNPEMSKVNIIQDSDMNKSIKYYCERLVEEHEDSIISLFAKRKDSVKKELCTNVTRLCSADDFGHEDDDAIEEESANEDHEEL